MERRRYQHDLQVVVAERTEALNLDMAIGLDRYLASTLKVTSIREGSLGSMATAVTRPSFGPPE